MQPVELLEKRAAARARVVDRQLLAEEPNHAFSYLKDTPCRRRAAAIVVDWRSCYESTI